MFSLLGVLCRRPAQSQPRARTTAELFLLCGHLKDRGVQEGRPGEEVHTGPGGELGALSGKLRVRGLGSRRACPLGWANLLPCGPGGGSSLCIPGDQTCTFLKLRVGLSFSWACRKSPQEQESSNLKTCDSSQASLQVADMLTCFENSGRLSQIIFTCA